MRALAVDDAFHAAKLTAVAFSEDRSPIWDEHEQYRNDLLAPSETVAEPDLWEQAKAIHEKVRRLGLVTHIPETPH